MEPEGEGDRAPANYAEQPASIKEFSLVEVNVAVIRFRSRGKAPCPDSIPSQVWVIVRGTWLVRAELIRMSL